MAERVTERYARALLELSFEEKTFKEVRVELEQIENLLASCEEFKTLFFKKVFSSNQKKTILKEIFEKQKMSAITKNFLYLLAEKNRLHLFLEIVRDFSKKLDTLENVVDVEVITAMDMPQKSQDDVEKRLGKTIGKKIRVLYKVDDGLVGGLVAKVGNKILDGSLKMQLKLFKEQLAKRA